MVRESAHDAVESMSGKAMDIVRSIRSGQPDHIDLTEFEDEHIGEHLT